MSQPYIPIDCERHDELLALATLRRPCTLGITRLDGISTSLEGIIEDVYTESGAEYLRLRGGAVARLDEIRTLDGKPFY